ncbi:PREDICTED: uncharacterized protein LOC106314707 [Brassica oleracea var. oleracea]|uniref:uncharacterized protein LOC106314707 n=1 Tax=Brassica oleracea var. oleracea TaxID=109376 RepID=UPI0006A6F60F|nr:PREDICTED: uncharacterized protein LOC106314707 [Brassica oleracea var. oleracea]
MDLPELPPRMFTLREELAAIRSISYHSDDMKLFKALCDCLTADEYEDLKASKLGVFIKFKKLEFGWTSRLVHFMLCFHLDIKKKFELWSLVASQPARFSLIEFEHLTGLNCDYIKDLENPRVAFKVLMDSLKAKDLTQTGYTVHGFIQVVQVWAYYAMPELGANYGSAVPNRPSPLLLAYKGGKGQRKCFKAAIKKQNNVNNFIRKDLDEMFPKWDEDVDDPAADNIIKVMFNDPGWKWTMDCWQVTGTHKVVNMEVSPGKNEVSPVKTEKNCNEVRECCEGRK